ncbi:MAG: hypothetical protein KJO35_04650, partial [Gammaproteobacteria bacterium]|nr:hypothetical protein [Gammaproteobacteria bacterium]
GLPRVLVVQLGNELDCMLTRGWIKALQRTAETEIVSHIKYREILDQLPNPTRYHPITPGPVQLLRSYRQLKNQNFDRALCLNSSIASRWLASVCPAEDRIQSTIGPPALPAEIDAVLAVLFGRLGVSAPAREHRLKLTSKTAAAADAILAEFGFTENQKPIMIAPQPGSEYGLLSSWHDDADPEILPVLLMPIGEEIDLINAVAGQAFLVPTPELSLRAALIGRAAQLISNDPVSRQLAQLMQTPLATDGENAADFGSRSTNLTIW